MSVSSSEFSPSVGAAWISTWTAPAQPAWGTELPFPTQLPSMASACTVRQPLRISRGGRMLRLVFSNEYGDTPLTLGLCRVALREQGQVGAWADLTFGGSHRVTLAAGERLRSDPLELPVPDLADLELAVYLPSDFTPTTFHWDARQTGSIEPGDRTGNEVPLPDAQPLNVRVLVNAVEVLGQGVALAVIGDSLVNGHGLEKNSHGCWADLLASHLAPQGIAVINAGQSGGRLLRDRLGISVLNRFERDVLSQPGVAMVIVQVGLNDLGWADSVIDPGGALPTLEALKAGYTALIEAAHGRGINVLGMTLTPFKGAFAGTPFEAFHQPGKDLLRHRLNRWLREDSGFDGVLDLDALLRDPHDPDRLQACHDSGDHLHPGREGSQAIAQWLLQQPALTDWARPL
ncbi:SGNH/GDSL hydrolase family protein [Pseudomonas entomophila]|uniref:SGNH/GDSL hydrolase family protein n=1 Tax=Pseudomonas entomophila TaxID=312306 RepID=UPI002405CDD8|nr:SGNH/GDSL hydrolase family protein [Pseudomonas entomophila]MDF9618350.1 SGNH/GDSL hydrolase family protein [Pseudomonas entomophila]